MKMIRERLSELRQLRSQVAVKETFYSATQSTKEPMYDVCEVDVKITQLENFLYLADSAIKEANAKTEVDLTVDINSLLEPLKKP